MKMTNEEALKPHEIQLPANRDELHDDYEFSRITYYKLIKSGLDMLETCEQVTRDSEHPRAFEVYTGMLKGISEINASLINLQKTKKEIDAAVPMRNIGASASDEPGEKRKTVFEGTPSEMIEQLNNEDVIEATVEDVQSVSE